MQRIETVAEAMAKKASYHLSAIREQVEKMAAAHTDKKQASDFSAAHFSAREHLRELEQVLAQ